MASRKPPNQPPEGYRFRKGKSGNPNGRPKKRQQSTSVFKDMFDMQVPTSDTENGMPVEDALDLKTFKLAIEGNAAAQRKVLKWIEERDLIRMEKAPRRSVVDVEYEQNSDNADKALRLLGMTDVHPYWPPQNGIRPSIVKHWVAEEALEMSAGRKMFSEDEMRLLANWVEGFSKLPWFGYEPNYYGEVDDE